MSGHNHTPSVFTLSLSLSHTSHDQHHHYHLKNCPLNATSARPIMTTYKIACLIHGANHILLNYLFNSHYHM